jgi:ribonucleoside-diphosphate reductase alpha chain
MSGNSSFESLECHTEKLTPKKNSVYRPPINQLQQKAVKPQKSKDLYVRKRDGRLELVSFNKILTRITFLSEDLEVNPAKLAQSVITDLYNEIESSKIDEIAADKAHHWCTNHPDYDRLASRIAISNHQKETLDVFSQVVWELYQAGLLNDEIFEVVQENSDVIDQTIDYDRDYFLSYIGFKTFEYSYSMRINEKPFERPQHMWMRVALGIHGQDLEAAFETYEWMSCKYFTHATPTLFNAGTNLQQMSSCFLVAMREEETHPYDSIEKIFETVSDCAKISKTAGGIGISISNVRAKGSIIRSAGRGSSGICPMLQVFNQTARYVDQGRRRKGAFAMYIEPWHADIFDFLDMKKNDASDEMRARDLHYALWIPDLFMKRVKEGGVWSLMCPDKSPGLVNVWGEEFEQLYEKYEKEGRYVKQVQARDVWVAITNSQTETGEPYMLYKDSCNRKSNQKNIGTIRSSNLCSEIIEFSNNNETAVCNLLSLGLPAFISKNEEGQKFFDHQTLHYVTKIATRNLNKVIDKNYYPTENCRRSNTKHRPIGIGVQGLADAFIALRLPFESEGARELNKEIFETIYYAALEASMELAKEDGPYESFKGSPTSQGILQQDMWGVEPSERWNWRGLKHSIQKYGLRNSLLIALMPTASTSMLLGYNEAFEPYTNNLYTRKLLSGTFKFINRQMILDLIKIGKWNDRMKQRVIAESGSIQNIEGIPQELKDLYKTVWEVKQSRVIDLAADRGAFVDQSQSMNLHIARPSTSLLSSVHMYAWEKGLKTGQYYLRTKPAVAPIKATIEAQFEEEEEKYDDEDDCLMCGA